MGYLESLALEPDGIAFAWQDPKPLLWSKTADDVLATVRRLFKRIPDSGHQLFTRFV